jgi:hypothetical protein
MLVTAPLSILRPGSETTPVPRSMMHAITVTAMLAGEICPHVRRLRIISDLLRSSRGIITGAKVSIPKIPKQ